MGGKEGDGKSIVKRINDENIAQRTPVSRAHRESRVVVFLCVYVCVFSGGGWVWGGVWRRGLGCVGCGMCRLWDV